jgi:branched-subunit amino acid ABC-type transport system permease component
MARDEGTRSAKRVVWGIFLIALGGMFMLERLGGPVAPDMGQLWPSVFYVIAVIHLLERRPGAALTMFLLGTWFLAVEFEWLGLTWRNSWPLALVVVGAGMVARALTGEGRRGPARCCGEPGGANPPDGPAEGGRT